MNYALSTIVHPIGMPLSPFGHFVIPAALTNVPVDATYSNQDLVQLVAEISVARHLI